MARERTTTVDVAEARTRLSELLRRVDAGEEIFIARDHKPVARLVAARLPGSLKPGSARGLFTMAPDFDAPLPDFKEYELSRGGPRGHRRRHRRVLHLQGQRLGAGHQG